MRPPRTNSRPESRGRAKRPSLTVLTVLLLAVALGGLGSFTAGCGEGGTDAPTGGETVRLVIPPGTAEKLDAGKPVKGIPDQIDATVGDTLVVENHDSSTQFVSGFAVSPGQTMKIPLTREGTYLTNCSAHEDRSIKMVVKA